MDRSLAETGVVDLSQVEMFMRIYVSDFMERMRYEDLSCEQETVNPKADRRRCYGLRN